LCRISDMNVVTFSVDRARISSAGQLRRIDRSWASYSRIDSRARTISSGKSDGSRASQPREISRRLAGDISRVLPRSRSCGPYARAYLRCRTSKLAPWLQQWCQPKLDRRSYSQAGPVSIPSCSNSTEPSETNCAVTEIALKSTPVLISRR